MKNYTLQWHCIILYIFILGFGTSANSVSLTCTFDYDEVTYEWLRTDQFSGFRGINDAGQALIVWNGTQHDVNESGAIGGSFLDPDSLLESRVVASFEFDGEFGDLIRIQIKGFNNAGEVFGDIYLVTGRDAEGNDLPGGFPPHSAGFAFIWDKNSGLRDLSELVLGLSGRSDIGYETAIAVDHINGHQFIVSQYFEDKNSEQSLVPFPFDLREPQTRTIPADMLDAMSSQCGNGAPVPQPTASADFNNNLEFTSGNNLVRRAKPRIDIRLVHKWSANNGDPIVPPRAAHLPGKVGERLSFELDIRNNGVVDVSNFEVSVGVIDSSVDEVLRFDGTLFNNTFFKGTLDENLPTFLDSGDRVNQLYKLFTAKNPGTATFEVVVTGIAKDGSAIELRKTQGIKVESDTPSLLSLLSFTDGRTSRVIQKNEQFGVTLNISATDGEGPISNIQISDLFAAAANLDIVSTPTIDASGYSLEEGQSLPPFNWLLKAKATGQWKLATTVTGTDNIGISKSDSATLNGSVGDILNVTFAITPSSLVLNEPDREGNAPSTRCKQLQDGEQDEKNPITNCIEITATISNIGDTTLNDVNIQGLTEGPHKGLTITSLTQNPGVPLTFIELEPAAGSQTIPESVSLPAGEFVKVTWRLNAFDGPANVRFRTLVTGSDNGKLVSSLGESDYQILSNVLAEIRIKPTRIGANVLEDGEAIEGLSGSTVHIGGTIKNTTLDTTLEIQLQEVVTGNAGHGILYSPEKWGSSRTPDARQPFQLEPEEELNISALVRTLRAITATDANVKYFVKAFTLVTNEDGSITKSDASDQVLFIVEEGFVNPVIARMLPNAPEEFDPIDECGTWYFSCGVVLGVENLAKGTWDMTKFLGKTLVDFGNQELMLLAWAGEITVTAMQAVMGSEAAFDALATEIAIDLQALVDSGAYTLGQGVSLKDAIKQAATAGVGEFGEAIRTGDLNRVQFQFGRFLGENPDLLPFQTMVTKLATAKSLARISGAEGASKITAEAIEELSKKTDDILEVSARYDAGRAKGQDITRDVAETGDLVAEIKLDANGKPLLDATTNKPLGDAGPVPKYWGAAKDDVLKTIAIAVDENVLISFRSRATEAITLVKNKLAWVKPGAYGVKGTTAIDLKYLDYPNNRLLPDGSIDARFPTTKGTTDLVEPPSQLIGKEGDLLETALDNYMDQVMLQRHPELATDQILAGQVRDRLKTRAEEWPKYLKKFDDWEVNGVDLSFGYNKQGIWEIFGRPVVDNRKIRLTKRIIDTPDGKRQVIQLDMSGPDGTDFRAITGDIDFLAILNANGTMLLNPIKRLRIYKKLQTALGMQHGESFTFALNQLMRAEWLRCCTRGVVLDGIKAEKMIVAQPNGKARIGEFIENKSITVDSANTAKRLDKSGDFIMISGVEYALKARQSLVNRLKFNTLADSIAEIVGQGFNNLLKSYSTEIFKKIIKGLNDTNGPTEFNRNFDSTIVKPDGKGGMLAWVPGFGFELVQLAELEPTSLFSPQRSFATRSIDPSNFEGIELFGSDGHLKLLPQSAVTSDISAGSTQIEIATQEEVGVGSDSPWFEVGDTIVINPGGNNQEIRTIAAFGSLIFTEPLSFSHQTGELVSVVFDEDNDGETIITDAFPNNPFEAFDNDNDGIGNNADLDDDNDGLLDSYEIAIGSNPNLADTDGDGINDNIDNNPLEFDETAPSLYSGQLTVLPDINDDGIKEVGILKVNADVGQVQLNVLNGKDQSVIRTIIWADSFVDTTLALHLIPDMNDNGADDVGLFGVQDSPKNAGKPQMFVRDLLTGNRVNVYNWPANWKVVSALVLTDMSGDGIAEIGIQGRFKDGNRPQLVIKNGANSGSPNTYAYPNLFTAPRFYQHSDMNGDGFEEIATFGRITRNNKIQVKIANGIDAGNKMKAYNFPDKWNNVSWHRLDDSNGDGIDDWGLFGINQVDGRPQLINKDGTDPRGALRIFAWPADISQAQFYRIPDMNNDGVDEVAAAGRRSNGRYQFQIQDGVDRNSVLANHNLNLNLENLGFHVLPDLSGDEKVEIGFLGINTLGEYELFIQHGNTADGEYARYNLGTDWSAAPSIVSLGDTDDDGLPDLLVFGQNGTGHTLSIMPL